MNDVNLKNLIDELGAITAEQLLDQVQAIDWSYIAHEDANEFLHCVGLYGYSGRTRLFASTVDYLLRQFELSLFTLIYLHENEQAMKIVDSSLCNLDDAGRQAFLDQRSQSGQTMLHCAAERGNVDMVRFLCERGCSLRLHDDRNQTPLDAACHAGPWKVAAGGNLVDVLLESGLEPDAMECCMIGDLDRLRQRLNDPTLDARAFVASHASDGETPLFKATHNNHVELVGYLLEIGADPNRQNRNESKDTPLANGCLHTLSGECDSRILHALIEYGAAWTMTAAVCLENLPRIASFYADYRESKESERFSPLYYAIHSWRPNSLKKLISLGMKVKDTDWDHIKRIAGEGSEVYLELRALSDSMTPSP